MLWPQQEIHNSVIYYRTQEDADNQDDLISLAMVKQVETMFWLRAERIWLNWVSVVLKVRSRLKENFILTIGGFVPR